MLGEGSKWDQTNFRDNFEKKFEFYNFFWQNRCGSDQTINDRRESCQKSENFNSLKM